MDTFIEYRDGKTLSLVNEGYITKDMVISPIAIINDATNVDWRPGVIRNYAGFGSRKIVVKVLFVASDELDFALKRDKLFSIFSNTEPIHILEGRPTDRTTTYDFEKPGEKSGPNNQLPTNIEKIKGKKYNVILNSMGDVEQNGLIGSCDIEFETYQLPYAESVLTTLAAQDVMLDGWQTGQGLLAVPYTERQYIFSNTPNMRVYNAGNVEVRNDLRDMYMKITLTGSSNNVRLVNNTNGSVFQFNGSTVGSDVLEISTPYSFKKNGANVFSMTNRGLFYLSPGYNDITATGFTSMDFIFDFKFYYK